MIYEAYVVAYIVFYPTWILPHHYQMNKVKTNGENTNQCHWSEIEAFQISQSQLKHLQDNDNKREFF
jgi:hypothetical protein